MKPIDLYFKLTKKQRKKLSELGHCHILLEQIPMSDWKQITKNKQLHAYMVALKRCYMKLAA